MSSDEMFAHKVIDACGRFLEDDVRLEEAAVSETPGRLYHFTDLATVGKIAENKTLRAGLSSTLNDPSEVRYGFNLALKQTYDLLQASPRDDYLIWLQRLMRDPSVAPGQLRFETFTFVACLCAQEGLSGQWLNYGRSGRGCAIGFDFGALHRLTRSSAPSSSAEAFELIRVDYSPERQGTRLRALIELGHSMVPLIPTTLPAAERQNEIAHVAHVVSIHIPMLSARFKHPSFAAEEEWRIVRRDIRRAGKSILKPPPSTQFRPEGAPFLEIPFGSESSAISEVVVGFSSSGDPDSLNLLLSHHGVHAPVRRSGVPVR